MLEIKLLIFTLIILFCLSYELLSSFLCILHHDSVLVAKIRVWGCTDRIYTPYRPLPYRVRVQRRRGESIREFFFNRKFHKKNMIRIKKMCTHMLLTYIQSYSKRTKLYSNSETFKGIAAASKIPAPRPGVRDPLKHKLTDLSIHIC